MTGPAKNLTYLVEINRALPNSLSGYYREAGAVWREHHDLGPSGYPCFRLTFYAIASYEIVDLLHEDPRALSWTCN